MRGHVAKKGSRYYAVYDVPRHPSGKRRQKWEGGFATKREAQARLSQVVHELYQGTFVAPTAETLAEFLREWLPAARVTLSSSTWASYRGNIELHVIPRVGSLKLRYVTGPRLNGLYRELLESGRVDGAGGLAPKTVRYIHTILHRALRDAVRWGRLGRNPADLADPPRVKRKEMRVWTATDLRAFLEHVRQSNLRAVFFLAGTTGMRRGEVLGLRWKDVNLNEGWVRVTQSLVAGPDGVEVSQPKTPKSRRQIALDDTTVNVLRDHRRRQAENALRAGTSAEALHLVFSRPDGSPVHPDSVTQAFERLARRAGLPPIRFHDLRHTCATIALTQGVHPRVVADRLGHASVAITLDTYSHVLESVGADAASTIAEAIFSE